ncbi:MAG TPA: hypothetical protein VFR34_11610 [Paracoccaceae bacterium]|nr:hypothetical protein [Paracoccaceae bacterium]
MFKYLTAGVLSLGLVFATGTGQQAQAHDRTAQIVVGTLAGVAAVGLIAGALNPYPVYVAPRPYYRPAYVAPRPYYRPVYVAPRYRPVYVAPRPVYVRPYRVVRPYYRPRPVVRY